jgi:hypothetical protein
MKRTTSMTIAALVVAVAAGAATAPVYAQDHGRHEFRGPGQDMQRNHEGPRGFFLERERGPGQMKFSMRGGPGGQRGGVLSFVCSPKGADRLEHLLLNISQRVDPTTEQQPLFDTLKSAARTAQTGFADTCAEARPERTAGADRPDLAERMKTRLAIETAHVEAMTSVIPAFEAFYDSLSDAQKQSLEPRRHRQHEGRRMSPPSPAPAEPAAPSAPPAPQQNG